jgi:hypothetical protein
VGISGDLKNVLSNLNRAPASNAVPEEMPEDAIPAPPKAPEISDSPLLHVEMPVQNEPPVSEAPPAPSAVDNDFWSGNVLGWPSGMEIKNAPEFHEPPPLSDSDRAFLNQDLPAIDPNPPVTNFFSDEPAAPPAEPAAPPAPETAAIPPMPEPPIPIPGNLEIRPDPALVEEKKELELERNEIKPLGVFQVACIFPEGEEKQEELFISHLKEAGQKARPALTIESVFVTAWVPGVLDFEAWTKSAVLSGADVMIILSRKKDFDMFKSITPDTTRDGVKTRFAALEYVPLRTLYADIVVELQRGR